MTLVSGPNAQSRTMLVLVVATFLAVGAGFAWICRQNPGISFLPHHASAEWIAYPNPPDSVLHTRTPLSAVFRRTFKLETVPASATLSVSAFRSSRVTLNDTVLDLPMSATKNWKETVAANVGARLRPGENQISVTVDNDNGPPCLWLILRTDKLLLRSDDSWESSWGGAPWRPARLATKPWALPRGNALAGGERPLESLKKTKPILFGLGLLALAGIALGGRWLASGGRSFGARHVWWAFGIVAALWVALFVNNLSVLPRLVGFDVDAHVDYIAYILKNHTLPLPQEGWEMYQQPLYYLLCAGILSVPDLGLDEAGVMLLRLFGLAIGVGHIAIVLASLRLLFPTDTRKQMVGLLVAGFIPARIYLAHYVSNEALAATLITLSLYVCLRILQMERAPVGWLAGLGACLGAALLTKVSTLLAVIGIFGVMVWHLVTKRRGGREILVTLGTVAGACLLVAGWHYARIWARCGRPYIGNWDPASGFIWWQYPGYWSFPYFARFGACLKSPLFSSFYSFGDGAYSTLWGDGLCGGTGELEIRPPWNYDLMVVGYWLALLPSLIILTGATYALYRCVRKPAADRLLVVGMTFTFACAVVLIVVKIPSYAQVKAFYGLSALMPLCAFAAEGWEILTRRSKIARLGVNVLLAVWALASYGSFWIHRDAPYTWVFRGLKSLEADNTADAVEKISHALANNRQPSQARKYMAMALDQAGNLPEARRQAEQALRDNSNDPDIWFVLAGICASQGDLRQAVENLRQVIQMAPEHRQAHESLGIWLTKLGDTNGAAQAFAEGLSISPTSKYLQEKRQFTPSGDAPPTRRD